MGWLFNIQSAQSYFAVGALLKREELHEIEVVQSTKEGSAGQNLQSFKLFQPVPVSCFPHVWLVQKKGVMFRFEYYV